MRGLESGPGVSVSSLRPKHRPGTRTHLSEGLGTPLAPIPLRCEPWNQGCHHSPLLLLLEMKGPESERGSDLPRFTQHQTLAVRYWGVVKGHRHLEPWSLVQGALIPSETSVL